MTNIDAISTQFPSPEQETLIDRAIRGESLLIVAGPGTGKSRTALAMAVQKVRSLGTDSREHVLFLSFSNATINRLAASAGILFGKKDRKHLRFMTFHSCAAELVSCYGRFVGLPALTRVIDRLEERLIAIEAEWDENSPDYGDRLFRLATEQGKLAFSVLLPLGTALLSSSKTIRQVVSRHYPLIIVDEFQDTSEDQWKFLKELGEQSQVVTFGDPNQIIYSSLHQATERRLTEFGIWKQTQTDSTLSTNHRCAQGRILEFADCLLAAKHFIRNESDPVKFSMCHRNELRARLAMLWRQIQDKIGAGQTIGILLPSNALVEEVSSGLRNPPPSSPVRFPVYAQMVRDEAAYDAVLLGLAAIKDYVLHPSDLLARKAVVALLAMNSSWDSRSRASKERISEIARILRLRKPGDNTAIGQLFSCIQTEPQLCHSLNSFILALAELPAFTRSAKRLHAHPALVRLAVGSNEPALPLFDQILGQRLPKGLQGDEAFEGKTHVLTYHKAKGREFDYTVLVVDPRHEPTKVPISEKRRLYYVAATRARKWLVIIYFGADHGNVLGPALLKRAQ
jgi:DNA helicase II / ATP-dependent DNA helicase PcrA